MAFLTFWRKQNKPDIDKDKEEPIYRTLLIKKLIDDVEDLKKKYYDLEIELKKTQLNNNKREEPSKQHDLTNLERKIYTSFLEKKPKTLEELSAITGVKIQSLRVYLSRIRSKGYSVVFNKE